MEWAIKMEFHHGYCCMWEVNWKYHDEKNIPQEELWFPGCNDVDGDGWTHYLLMVHEPRYGP